MKDTTTTIDEILKKAWEHGYYSSNHPSDPNMTWFSDDKQALLKWHQDKARSYVLEAVESSFIPLSHLYDKYSDECFHLGVTDSPSTFFDSDPVKKLIDQTLKAIEEDQ